MSTGPLTPSILALAGAWRADAQRCADLGDERGRLLLTRSADQLEAAIAADQDAVLTLDEAAREANLSKDHLRHLIADGTIPNAGRRNAPRVRRADLPRKAPKRTGAPAGGFDPERFALELHTRTRAG